MKQFPEAHQPNAAVLFPVAVAVIWGVAFFVVGFGLALSVASAFFGWIFGRTFLHHARNEPESEAQLLLARTLGGDPIQDKSRLVPSMTSSDTGAGWFLSELAKIFVRGPLIQRAAARIFIAQTAAGALMIPLFWLAQWIGLDLSQLSGSFLIQLPAERFLIGASTIAKARYDGVFVPLAVIYGVSLPMLTAAFLGSLGAAFQNVRKHWRALVVVPSFIIAPALMIFDDSYVTRRWQALIVAGDMWGYVMMFILVPFCLLVLTASLPRWDSR